MLFNACQTGQLFVLDNTNVKRAVRAQFTAQLARISERVVLGTHKKLEMTQRAEAAPYSGIVFFVEPFHNSCCVLLKSVSFAWLHIFGAHAIVTA